MLITRKKFLQIFSGSIAGFALSNLWLPKLLQAANVKNGKGRLPIVWFQGQNCSGCPVSFVNTEYPSADEVLIEVITLEYLPTIMGGTGDVAVDILERMITDEKGKFILAIDGSIPVDSDGNYCNVGEINGKSITALKWIQALSSAAGAVVAIGTCATWGGIPAAPPNPTKAKAVRDIVKDKPVINIPGCPPHPDWIVGTLVHVLKYGIPTLDDLNRPVIFFGPDKIVHDNCELRQYFDAGIFAKDFGQKGCLYELGCKGPVTHCDAPVRGWNSGVNWCNRSGGPCLGCTEPTFPGGTGSGFYEKLPAVQVPGLSEINANANTIGIALGGAVGAAIAGHAIARAVSAKKLKQKSKQNSDVENSDKVMEQSNTQKEGK
ncbi:MAG: hydrogenase small subunit [Actinobacteria bacterium]|nr:hydrogenase small subunit [Cyanobacteriota bacterium]MCL5772228.1 hydrogenase small subunit [Actinomycetota bacterium]